MGDVQEFRDAVAELEIRREAVLDYVRNMNNWLCVHATRSMPSKSKDGGLYIQSTAMATGFEKYPRSTVHFTLNHVVGSHGYGNWDATPFVLLAPYNSLVKLNDNPAEVSATDTYWSVDPDVGFRLPENTYIVKPSNDVLFHIGENIATYKTDNFTDEEIKQIESMMTSYDLYEYEKYKNADFMDYEIEQILMYAPDVVKKMYAGSKDKKAFLRGMYEESKYEILTKYLRNVVVSLAMDKIGYQYVSCGDACEKSVEIAKVAHDSGLNANASNKGHSNSIYCALEEVYGGLRVMFEGGICNDGLYGQKNVDGLYNELVKMQKGFYVNEIIDSIISDKSIDFYGLYLRRFKLETVLRNMIIGTIAEFDEKLDKTLRKNSEKLSKKYVDWLNQIKQWSGYSDLVVKLKGLKNQMCLMSDGRGF